MYASLLAANAACVVALPLTPKLLAMAAIASAVREAQVMDKHLACKMMEDPRFDMVSCCTELRVQGFLRLLTYESSAVVSIRRPA